MKQQIIISGMGGQGVLFLTRIIAGAAMEMGLEVMTSETHGMAQRGGSVISFVKAGSFRSPLIRQGQGDVGLFLHSQNLEVHQNLLKPDADIFVNTADSSPYPHIDATGLATESGSPVLANLILLGFAVKNGLFCQEDAVKKAINSLSRQQFIAANLAALARSFK
jgi:indolepyruvate ferredoxin oxidoreductase beta subunit